MESYDIKDAALNRLSEIADALLWLSTVTPEGASLLKLLSEQIEHSVFLLDKMEG